MACFFPPTNFLALEGLALGDFAAPFDIREFNNKSGTYKRVSAERRREVGRARARSRCS